ncbi:MAG: DUF1501 domain-containing protein, partial [Planctomycetaceae bacterium]|nr:DUF1501 domain-containing protein [Planctomycetaceae bacterium]
MQAKRSSRDTISDNCRDGLFNRREMLRTAGGGIGMMALHSLLASEKRVQAASGTLSPKEPDFEPRAKRLIWLFMHGGPSHVDLWDPKPDLVKYSGKPLPDSFGEVMTRRKVAKNPLLAPIKPFRKRGESGLEV